MSRQSKTAYMREWTRRNRERVNAQRRARYDPAKKRAYDEAHREQGVLARRARYAANRDRLRREHDAWRRANPERDRARCAARRARKAGARGSHTVEQWLARLAEFGGRCAYCGSTDRIERDHITPLTRGGTDFIDNIVPACKSCNAGKHNKLLSEWGGPTSARTQVRAA